MTTVMNPESTVLEFKTHSRIEDAVSKNTSGNKIQEQTQSGLNKVLELGPLESVFPGSESKILDFLIAFQEFDYSISDISRNSGVGFKTALKIVNALEGRKMILKNRNVGRAKMFKLNLGSPEAISVSKLALEIAVRNSKS